MALEQLMTVRETSRHLGVCEATVRRWIVARKVAVYKMGRAVRIPSDNIAQLIQQGYRPAATKCTGQSE